MSQPKVGIVITGTEVLTGRVRDANGPWLATALREQGLDLVHITICRDRPGDVRKQLEFMAAEGMDLVVTTGGLGPTADDLTAAVVSEYMGREMTLDEELLLRIEAIVRPYAERFGWDWDALAHGARKQAMIPNDSEILGPAGTAPGLVIGPQPDADQPVVVVLPGPPRELQNMWPEVLTSAGFQSVAAKSTVFEERMLRLFGVAEPEIAKTMREFDEQHGLDPLEVTTCLRNGETEILISHDPSERDRCEAFVDVIQARHGDFLFSPMGKEVDQLIVAELAGRTLALAESCTGGLIAKRLTDMPGASDFLLGGVVSYANSAKERLLDVAPELLERHGAVSAEVARAMATGALERFGADFALSVTGIAGPEGASEGKPVGTVFMHAVSADGANLPLNLVLPGDRVDVRERSGTVCLHLLLRLLQGDHE
ncbi:MAG: competence/damage-inducible protein A [Thermoleophilaceae bacterium]|nr:competence/damage-inducible protein A [Thermoleophilaceae bacterium]